ncbi:MAG: hypothetical protein M3413_04525 [Bacteroidota bacterium]|jgi:hypothetical protein|nr:hypothetical protein [Flavisolibacter sp.]MDQ3550772.1 hypothetical protein [Bacteroidota bacterium]
MEVTAAVLFGGALAHYDVSIQDRGVYRARLSAYKGSPENLPPADIIIRKEGRHWVSDIADNNLSEDIGYAVEIKVPKDYITNERKRGGGHPAN